MSDTVTAAPKPEVPVVSINPVVAAETARCRKIVEECVAKAKKQVATGSFPSDVCGVLGREILTRLEAKK